MCQNCQNKVVGKAPFRVDHVGSYLRPKELVEAREKFSKGELSKEELTKVEDKLIAELVEKQIAAGLKGVTDGEFRRAYWHLDFFWGLNGIEHVQGEKGYAFKGIETKPDTAKVSGKISGENHPFVEHFKYLRDITKDKDVVVKLTIPSPSQLYFELIRTEDHIKSYEQFYSNFDELKAAIVAAYKQVINDLYNEGLRVLQFDDCTWGALADDGFANRFRDERPLEEVRRDYAARCLALNNEVIEGKPEDLVINTHVCRGNFASKWISQGGYQNVEDELLAGENVDAYYLEYDTDRAGDFKPLAKVGKDKKVVLGLITSKFADLEDKEEVIARIKEASQYIPLENIYLSTQCGFASTEEGNVITEEDQWKKIALISEIVDEVWGTK
ncbi:5-methyltetrahydropteroyltriglutamate--homocysteine S-methyltransferase [Gemella sanguinis]|jgi:methionine synthase, vitamin-B12 independent|uniref:5-methyltetrahydropteroyltriglutamate--homocysteine S-methyltransferase n=1 Tax=Gemella sanguinis TaxID=84135 RepID=A0A2N6SD17_9BACL|nr:5-methyltetrahydropteroyltriglutamate--homocysteine S-methyltransferase [Gemella sanguinis]PMC51779.1 5-methyltetrahydropteroyltriglutamate--homocysteine S-methyltransferase [Gemella sanguinis]